MGYSSYSSDSRTTRATIKGYHTKSRDDIFTQSKIRKIHESMNPMNVEFREARDSETHPNTVPIQIYLDVTGSMGELPHEFIKDGLPTLISTIIEAGILDVALMFGAIGDHECDNAPLQISQFESGDKELDMWLERTWLEGRGGSNCGESYALAWYFAANHVKTDAWDKRGKKGFIFTIGDEPVLNNYPSFAIKEIMGKTAKTRDTISAEQLLEQAMITNNVFHIHVKHNTYDTSRWEKLLGQHFIVVKNISEVPKIIAKTILANIDNSETKTINKSGELHIVDSPYKKEKINSKTEIIL